MQVSKSLGEVLDLVRLVVRFGPNSSPLLTKKTLNSSHSTASKLYREVEKGNFSSEGALVRSVLTSREPLSKYRIARARLKAALLGNLFFLNLEGYSEYSRSWYHLRRQVFFADTLRMLNARPYATRIASSNLTRALELEDWGSARQLLSILRTTAAQSGECDQHSSILRSIEFVEACSNAELEAELAMDRVHLAFAYSTEEHPDLVPELEQAVSRCCFAAQQYGGFKLPFLSIRLRSTLQQLKMDFRDAFQICLEAHALLDNHPRFANRARYAEFAIKEVVCALHLRDYDRARHSLKRAEGLLEKEENNWYTLMEYSFVLKMHQGEFETAQKLVAMVRSTLRYASLSHAARLRWDLYLLYAEYATGKPLPFKSVEHFTSYLRDLSQDKAGFNVSILILHLLVLLEARDFSSVIDRIGALQIYRKRYLRGEANGQAEVFFRLLFQLERASFDKELLRKRSRNLEEEMRQKAIGVLLGLPILPYEWIWERILELI